MPTFQFFHNGSKIDEFSGASPDKLRATIDKHRSLSVGGGGSNWGGGGGGYVLGKRDDSAAPGGGGQILGQPSAQIPSALRESPPPGNSEHPFIATLSDMGFPRAKVEKAVSATGGVSIEAAMEW
jgi:hypothetical protein